LKFRVKTGHGDGEMLFCSCDLDLNPMTSIYVLYLDILKCTRVLKMNFLGSRLSKVGAVKQTCRQTWLKTFAFRIRGW